MYLLDTNALSEYRKIEKGKAHPNFVQWQQPIQIHELFLSTVTIMEINIGILRLARKDEAQARVIKHWFQNNVIPNFAHRILDFDTEVALICSHLHVPDQKSDRDAMIGATAIKHGLTVVSRNISDFENMNVPLINPFSDRVNDSTNK